MNLLLLAYLGLVTLAVVAGASLSGLLDRHARTKRLTIAFSAGVMLAVCMLYLIPDALSFQHGLAPGAALNRGHWGIGFALSLGFLSLLTMERYLLRSHHHHAPAADADPAHDCRRDHDPPHHHQHDPLRAAARAGLGVAWSITAALCLHGLFDGAALYAAGVMPAMGPALALALFLHKVPESATLNMVLRRGGVRPRARALALAIYTAATPLGMLLAAALLSRLSQGNIALLMAFVAGSLLHLTTGHLLPEATEHDAHDAEGRHHEAYVTMLAGFCLLLLARVLGA